MAPRAPLVGAVVVGTALFQGACWCSGAWRSEARTGVQSGHAATAQQLRGASNVDAGFSGAALAGLPMLLGIAALSRARSPAARQAVVIEKGGSKKSSCASWPTEHMNAGQAVGPCTYPVETQHFVLEGKVVLKEEGAGEKTMEAGDFVTFQKGTKVTWDVKDKFNAHFQVNGDGPLDDGWTRPCA